MSLSSHLTAACRGRGGGGGKGVGRLEGLVEASRNQNKGGNRIEKGNRKGVDEMP